MTYTPWHVKPCPTAPGDIDVHLGDDFRIYIPLQATNWDDAKRARMKSHATLIAAAPLMLDALKWALDYGDFTLVNRTMRRNGRSVTEVDMANGYHDACAAIDAATKED